jgi:hypothetical protein
LCGVDNALGRAALESVGFHRVIEAGLGRGTEEYLAFQVHTFPARRSARERWGGGVTERGAADAMLRLPAYQSLAAAGVDQCGLTMLAGRSVGASFVGAATATIVIAELLRMVMPTTCAMSSPKYSCLFSGVHARSTGMGSSSERREVEK